MDTDLFQILALILLLGLLLTLFGVLQSLGAIRRTLEGREGGEVTPTAAAAARPAPAAETTREREPESQPGTWAAGDPAATAAPATDEPARTGWPAPQEAAAPEPAAAVEEPAAGTTAPETGARVLYGDTGLTTATPNESALRPAAEEPEPDTTAAASAGGTDARTGGAAEDAAEDPQEQPFERDGRWWFRRGDELLVYEEQTGQWVAAGDQQPGGAPASASAGATGAAGTGAAPAEGQVTTQQEAVGSFWKCPSCGAVNGSTATSCRMCFTARP